MWEVWLLLVIATVHIYLKAKDTEFNGFLGNCVFSLAPSQHFQAAMQHPVREQEGYRQLPRFKFNGDNVREFMQGFP